MENLTFLLLSFLLFVLILFVYLFSVVFYWWKNRPVSSKMFKVTGKNIVFYERMACICFLLFILSYTLLTFYLLLPEWFGVSNEAHRIVHIVLYIIASICGIAYSMYHLGYLMGIKSTKVEEK